MPATAACCFRELDVIDVRGQAEAGAGEQVVERVEAVGRRLPATGLWGRRLPATAIGAERFELPHPPRADARKREEKETTRRGAPRRQAPWLLNDELLSILSTAARGSRLLFKNIWRGYSVKKIDERDTDMWVPHVS